ncbi:MAG: alpha/beta fold hydrolase [Lachnospiraceae bacterium]|nr:alpha/beta fold hydrolase [Lachnospiraceae bacterium]
MKSKKKKILIALLCVLILMVIGWWAFTISIYNENFDVRFESYEPRMLHLEDFDGLECEEYCFESDKGQKLAGYMYSYGEDQHAIVVIAHGFGGGGHNSYMDCADYFARNGFYVFAYDATGNDKSEGDGVGGIPQGVIDLDHAISFVEENFSGFPIVLFGHSWGGYSACSVLTYHPEVKAVIECSGCNSSADMFESGGKKQAGDLIYTMTPFVKIHERVKYGKYASNTAMDGFAASDAKIMVVHSSDDKVIYPEYGYDIYYKEYKDDPRFTFVRFEDRGHDSIMNDPDNTYTDEFNAQFDKWLTTLDYDYKADENKDRFIKDKADYINENLDHYKWSHRLNTELFEQFTDFYNNAIKQ